MRMVSLLPSATEIVYALGLDDQLLGVTFECDEPPSARTDKKIVIGGRDTNGMSPAAIDDYVNTTLAAGADLYTLRADVLADLNPDLILTQDLCRVCAVPTGQVSDTLDQLNCHADVISLDPHTLDDVLASIITIGQRAGAGDRAETLVASLRTRLRAVATRVGSQTRPKVAMLEWVDPPFTAGHWVPDLVTAAGGTPVACRPGRPSTQTSWAKIAAAGPDLIFVTPCGFHLDGAAQQAAAAVKHLPGVPIWAIDADGLIVRPGPRLVDGVEAIASAIHPDPTHQTPSDHLVRIA